MNNGNLVILNRVPQYDEWTQQFVQGSPPVWQVDTIEFNEFQATGSFENASFSDFEKAYWYAVMQSRRLRCRRLYGDYAIMDLKDFRIKSALV